MTKATKPKPQIDRFKEAAKTLECDPDEARWSDRLKKIAKAKTGKAS